MVAPKMTVLMPVYNAARFLRQAMNSILSQTFQDFEFLIIDDGSTDDSVDIVRSYTDPRIRLVLNEENLGISETLNKGIRMASCELIARMDADDISNPYRLLKQYNYMLAHPNCALLSTWARVVSEDYQFVRLERYRSQHYYYNLTFECWMYHPTVVFKKSAVLEAGGYTMRYSEDYDLFWRMSTLYEIGNIAEPLVNYRLASTSLHNVLKKAEYDLANEQNVLRNLRFYMGDDFKIAKECLECLRHNFDPIVETQNIAAALQSLHLLDQITEKILAKDNPNRTAQAIREAHFYKREFIISQLTRALPLFKKLQLIAATHAWLIAWSIGTGFVRRRIRSFFLSF